MKSLVSKIEVGDVKKLKVSVSNFATELEPGDEVKVIDIGERGYDLMHVDSGHVVRECGWDIFKD